MGGHAFQDGNITNRRKLYIDGSALTNLLAIDVADDILLTSSYECITLQEIADECMTTSRILDAPLVSIQEGSPVNVLAVSNLYINEFVPIGQEVDLVAFAVLVPDNLAKLLTDVMRNSAALATDDTCVARIMRQLVPDVEILGLPDLLRRWQLARGLSAQDIAPVLKQVELRAHYDVPASHPYATWWRQILETPS